MFIVHLVNPAQCHNSVRRENIEVESDKSSQSTHSRFTPWYTCSDFSFRSELQDLSWSTCTPLYSFLMFWKQLRVAHILSNKSTQLHWHRRKTAKVSLAGKTRTKSVKFTSCILVLRRKHRVFEIWACDLLSAEHGLVTMPPTDGSMMSRHLSPHQDCAQSLKSNGIGDTWDLQTTWLICVLLRRTQL